MQQSKKSQKGATLITALIFLVMLTALAMSSMTTNILDERMAANTQEKNRAFQTAETALEIALNDSKVFNTAGYTDTVVNLGDYEANAIYTSEFLQSVNAAAVFQSGADIQGGSQIYHYFNLRVDANTNLQVDANTNSWVDAGIESGATSRIDAGAWHL